MNDSLRRKKQQEGLFWGIWWPAPGTEQMEVLRKGLAHGELGAPFSHTRCYVLGLLGEYPAPSRRPIAIGSSHLSLDLVLDVRTKVLSVYWIS